MPPRTSSAATTTLALLALSAPLAFSAPPQPRAVQAAAAWSPRPSSSSGRSSASPPPSPPTPSIGQWLGNATSKKFPALGFGYGGAATYTLSLDWMLPHPTAFNPFASQDPQLTAMLASAAAAPQEQQPALYQNVMRRVVDQA